MQFAVVHIRKGFGQSVKNIVLSFSFFDFGHQCDSQCLALLIQTACIGSKCVDNQTGIAFRIVRALSNLKREDVKVVDDDLQTILADTIARYERDSSKTLQPAHIERLLINVYAYREALTRQQVNEAYRQQHVRFATGLMLDLCGDDVSTPRLQAQPALTTLRFTAVLSGLEQIAVPKGTRVNVGQTSFVTTEAALLPVGAVIGFPHVVSNPEGYLKADGSTFAQATYPDLYLVLGSNKLPKLNRSDVGMTAYFPIEAIPDGWIKYDEIAAKVTQSAYPELYRKLVAQYGSITAVPKADDRFIRNASGSLTVGTQQGDAIRNIKGKTSFCGDGNGTLGIGPKDPEGVFGGEGSPTRELLDEMTT